MPEPTPKPTPKPSSEPSSKPRPATRPALRFRARLRILGSDVRVDCIFNLIKLNVCEASIFRVRFNSGRFKPWV
jgi:hypothetical protein